jgi:hypothetical protein
MFSLNQQVGQTVEPCHWLAEVTVRNKFTVPQQQNLPEDLQLTR